MQIDADGTYLGSNAKVFPILAIEEPEAHLHPTMQFQFVKFLKDNLRDKKVRQVFITSHSTHITSSARLDDLICLYKLNNKVKTSYPSKVFIEATPDQPGQQKIKSKKYVQRFLDATKSNMLFAERIILVEGMSEQLLIPVFANYLGLNLEEKHVAVINIGGRYFQHFLYLFDSTRPNTLNRKIACITDIDPMRQRKKELDDTQRPQKCYPYEYDLSPDQYTYYQNTSLKAYEESQHPNIRAYTQDRKYGKTLEYQIAFENPQCKLIVTPSIKNGEELIALINAFSSNEELKDFFSLLRDSKQNKRISYALETDLLEGWTDEEKKKAIIASRYLNSVEKGENALELSTILQERYIEDPTAAVQEFHVPEYIKNAIEWVCDD